MMFQHVDAYPGDPILTLNEDFLNDPRPDKVNLSIGVYLNEAGQLPVMEAVLQAQTSLSKELGASPYLPMEGARAYREKTRQLIFGEEHEALAAERIATIQTIGGSGALKIGADFLMRYFPDARIWVSDPTWDNHRAIFAGAGFVVNDYPYYSHTTRLVDFPALRAALEALPAGDIIVLHACCHNPTGADLSEQQWRELAILFRERSLLPFFDIAYQGFGQGIDEDAFAIRHFAAAGIPLLVASSFSKNFSLYGERCGSLHVVCPDTHQADRVLGQLKATVRRNYSSPPVHGSRIISMVLEDSRLRAEWTAELSAMRMRIKAMREGLYARLQPRRPDVNFDYLLKQTGMFSYTGLTLEQVRKLRDEFAIYVVESGRICVAALTRKALAPVADAMLRVLD
jgi:aromatic-amino-acid transaminase